MGSGCNVTEQHFQLICSQLVKIKIATSSFLLQNTCIIIVLNHSLQVMIKLTRNESCTKCSVLLKQNMTQLGESYQLLTQINFWICKNSEDAVKIWRRIFIGCSTSFKTRSVLVSQNFTASFRASYKFITAGTFCLSLRYSIVLVFFMPTFSNT